MRPLLPAIHVAEATGKDRRVMSEEAVVQLVAVIPPGIRPQW